MITVQIINKSPFDLPSYAHVGDSGVDLRADTHVAITLYPLERMTFPTGIYISPPPGVEAQVRPKSGWAATKGIVPSFGTVDQIYTGEVGVTLFNLSNEPVTINPGDRIAQLVFVKYETAEWNEVEDFEETARGDHGFGSTGIK